MSAHAAISQEIYVRPIIPPLTSSRFFAALAVVLYHYDRNHLLFPTGLADFGYEAVTFFFVLSGFILTYTHGRDSGLNVTTEEFAVARLVRLLPSYFLGLCISFPFFWAANLRTEFQNIWTGLIFVPTMTQSWFPAAALLWNPPAWSLSNEIFFYVLYAAIWRVWGSLPLLRSLVIASALVIGVALFRSVVPDESVDWRNFDAYFPLLNLPQFILGITLAKLFIHNGAFPKSNFVLLVSAAFILIIAIYKPTHPWLVNNPLLCIVFGTIIYSLAGLQGQLRAVLSGRYLLKLGEASYAIYILHFPIWLWWDRAIRVSLAVQLPPYLDFALYLTIVVGISVTVMSFIEKPLRKLALSRFKLYDTSKRVRDQAVP